MSDLPSEASTAGRQQHVRARTRHIVTAGLLAALLASAAWIALPVGTVPLTLQVFVVVLIALTLPPGWALAATGTYLLLGGLGAPVFAGGHGGLGVLVGPTGGYLLGFLAGAGVGSLARKALVHARVGETVAEGMAALAALVVIYALGWGQLALVTHTRLLPAFAVGVAPFVVFDVAKAAAAVAVASALRRTGAVR